VFEGRIIDQSHLEVGEFLGEGIATSTTLTQMTIKVVISDPKLCTIISLGCPGAFGKVYRGKFWSDTKPPASKQVAIKTLKSMSSYPYMHPYKS